MDYANNQGDSGADLSENEVVMDNRFMLSTGQEEHINSTAQRQGMMKSMNGGLLALAIILLCEHAAYSMRVFSYPAYRQVQYMPDDAYYYLSLARHHARTGVWTLDGGVSRTSGFHLLHAAVLSMLARLTEKSSVDFVQWAIAQSTALSLLTLTGILYWSRRISPFLLAAAVIVLSGITVIRMGPAAMEWPYALLMSGVFFLVTYESLRCTAEGGRGRPLLMAVLLAIAGFVGSLSRSEFGVIAFALGVPCIAIGMLRRRPLLVLIACCGLAGALAGLGTELLHNRITVGAFLQDSARVKAHWTQFRGFSMGPPLRIIAGLYLPARLNHSRQSIVLSAGIMLLALGAGAFAFRRRLALPARDVAGSPIHAAMIAGSLICLASLLCIYGMNREALEMWYNVLAIVPASVLLAYLLAAVFQLAGRHGASLVTGIVATCFALNTFEIITMRAPEPEAQDMYLAGKILRAAFPQRRAGAWNAGIINYYQGGSVVNIDGVMNHEIYPYIVSGRFMDYLREARIEYVVDFTVMLTNPNLQARGGYDGRLLAESVPVLRWPSKAPESPWNEMQIRRVRDVGDVPTHAVTYQLLTAQIPREDDINLGGGYVLRPSAKR
jgi:hypothetical protein